VKTAVCFRAVPHRLPKTGELRDRCGPQQYLAKEETAADFGARLYTWATRLGAEQAGTLVVLGDGATWIWNLAQQRWRDAVQILDFYHAAQYVWSVAHAVFPDADQAAVWARKRCRRLVRRGPQGLLRGLRALQRVGAKLLPTAAAQQAVAAALGYFGGHAGRMDYPGYRAQGLMIGSGPVEAACKVMVGGRLKGAGKRWTQLGADAVLAVRALVLGRRFDDLLAFARVT